MRNPEGIIKLKLLLSKLNVNTDSTSTIIYVPSINKTEGAKDPVYINWKTGSIYKMDYKFNYVSVGYYDLIRTIEGLAYEYDLNSPANIDIDNGRPQSKIAIGHDAGGLVSESNYKLMDSESFMQIFDAKSTKVKRKYKDHVTYVSLNDLVKPEFVNKRQRAKLQNIYVEESAFDLIREAPYELAITDNSGGYHSYFNSTPKGLKLKNYKPKVNVTKISALTNLIDKLHSQSQEYNGINYVSGDKVLSVMSEGVSTMIKHPKVLGVLTDGKIMGANILFDLIQLQKYSSKHIPQPKVKDILHESYNYTNAFMDYVGYVSSDIHPMEHYLGNRVGDHNMATLMKVFDSTVKFYGKNLKVTKSDFKQSIINSIKSFGDGKISLPKAGEMSSLSSYAKFAKSLSIAYGIKISDKDVTTANKIPSVIQLHNSVADNVVAANEYKLLSNYSEIATKMKNMNAVNREVLKQVQVHLFSDYTIVERTYKELIKLGYDPDHVTSLMKSMEIGLDKVYRRGKVQGAEKSMYDYFRHDTAVPETKYIENFNNRLLANNSSHLNPLKGLNLHSIAKNSFIFAIGSMAWSTIYDKMQMAKPATETDDRKSHAAMPTTLRRLWYTDFGSGWRGLGFGSVSGIIKGMLYSNANFTLEDIKSNIESKYSLLQSTSGQLPADFLTKAKKINMEANAVLDKFNSTVNKSLDKNVAFFQGSLHKERKIASQVMNKYLSYMSQLETASISTGKLELNIPKFSKLYDDIAHSVKSKSTIENLANITKKMPKLFTDPKVLVAVGIGAVVAVGLNWMSHNNKDKIYTSKTLNGEVSENLEYMTDRHYLNDKYNTVRGMAKAGAPARLLSRYYHTDFASPFASLMRRGLQWATEIMNYDSSIYRLSVKSAKSVGKVLNQIYSETFKGKKLRHFYDKIRAVKNNIFEMVNSERLSKTINQGKVVDNKIISHFKNKGKLKSKISHIPSSIVSKGRSNVRYFTPLSRKVDKITKSVQVTLPKVIKTKPYMRSLGLDLKSNLKINSDIGYKRLLILDMDSHIPTKVRFGNLIAQRELPNSIMPAININNRDAFLYSSMGMSQHIAKDHGNTIGLSHYMLGVVADMRKSNATKLLVESY